MRIGILTGGGDTASLNAVIYGAVAQAEMSGNEIFGFIEGWKGVLDPVKYRQLHNGDIKAKLAGTSILTSRESLKGGNLEQAVENISNAVDGLIAIGGDDTLTVGRRLVERLGIPVCFVTKTIDNDVGRNAPEGKIDYGRIVNYFTSGFPTAALKAAVYARELESTSKSHKRIMFLETMGRSPGWLALSTYRAQPDFILVPEVGLDFEDFKGKLAARYKEQGYAIVVVAEGVRYKGADKPICEDAANVDEHGHKKLGGVAELLADRVRKELGIKNCNADNPNYLYRCGISYNPENAPAPSELDLSTGITLGCEAEKAVSGLSTGRIAVLERRGDKIVALTKPIDEVLLTDASGKIIPRNLDLRFYNASRYGITAAGKEYFKAIR